MNDAADDVIIRARKASKNMKSKSLLQLLFDAQEKEVRGQKLKDVELRDETKTFLLAGHETTATWLYWAVYALAKYPDVQEKLYREILRSIPQTQADEDITVEQVENAEYLVAFLNEVLRLYPPVGFLERFNRKEENFCGYTIPVGTRLVISPHLLHRNPKYWKDPEIFLPERWIRTSDNINNENDGGKNKGFAFIPFSAGSRNCIGQRFSSIEALLIMAPIVRTFRIEIAPSVRNEEFQFTTRVTMKAKPDLKIVVKRR